MFICFDLVFTVEKNLTSSVSPQLSARCLGLFFMWSGSFHRWIYTLTFPLFPCAPCPDMRTEQLGMKRLWQPHFGMRSHFSTVTAELALTFSPLAALSCQPRWGRVCWSRHSVTTPEVKMHPKAGALHGALPVATLLCGNLLFLPFLSWHHSKWILVLKALLVCAVYECDYVCWKQPCLFYFIRAS